MRKTWFLFSRFQAVHMVLAAMASAILLLVFIAFHNAYFLKAIRKLIPEESMNTGRKFGSSLSDAKTNHTDDQCRSRGWRLCIGMGPYSSVPYGSTVREGRTRTVIVRDHKQ